MIAIEWQAVGLVAMNAILDLPKMDGKIKVGAWNSWERAFLDVDDLPGLFDEYAFVFGERETKNDDNIMTHHVH